MGKILNFITAKKNIFAKIKLLNLVNSNCFNKIMKPSLNKIIKLQLLFQISLIYILCLIKILIRQMQ